jgi:hypothetical protein
MAEPVAELLHNKLLVAAISSLITLGIKVLWDEWMKWRRWGRLSPLVLRQLAATAASCEHAFDTTMLPRAQLRFMAVQASATEMVAAGVHVQRWLAGLEHVAANLDAIQAAAALPASQQGQALEDVRAQAAAVAAWIKTTPSS